MREYGELLTAKSIRLVLNHNIFTYTWVGLPSRVVIACQKVKTASQNERLFGCR